jgi:LPXTG-motif cell wall-anchored protein
MLEKDKKESPLFAWVIIALAIGCILLFIRKNKKEIENRKSYEEMAKQYK